MIQMNNTIKKKLMKTFNTRIQILEKVKEVTNGRQEDKHINYFRCGCNTRELYGKELFEAINVKFEECLNFEVRYCKKINDMRLPDKNGNKRRFIISYLGIKYDIYYMDFFNESKTNVLIKSKRII